MGDLKVTLIATDGTEIVLVANEGGGANFTHTIFLDCRNHPSSALLLPTGDFKAEDETEWQGWSGKRPGALEAEDRGHGNGENGKLLSWGLFVASW